MTTDSIRGATGYWPALVYSLIEKSSQVRDLERQANAAKDALEDIQVAKQLFAKFGLDVDITVPILTTLAELGEAIEPEDLSDLSEAPIDRVHLTLAWGELLGIVRREGANHWVLDEIVKQILLSVRK